MGCTSQNLNTRLVEHKKDIQCGNTQTALGIRLTESNLEIKQQEDEIAKKAKIGIQANLTEMF